ncbi:MAG: DUF1295 domain-containing protein, partial [Elusimicrobia bacterium]|nr:DUF1295 domain-containing protein [Elusimicrobiota bacterium]
ALIIIFFSKPVSGWHFVIGVCIAFVGIAVRSWAAGYVHGKTFITTAGPYAYVRHPLYTGSFLIGFGLCLMVTNINALMSTLVMWVLFAGYFFSLYRSKIMHEEKLMRRQFKSEYDVYVQAVPAYIPFKKPSSKGTGTVSLDQWIRHREYLAVVLFIIALIRLISVLEQ